MRPWARDPDDDSRWFGWTFRVVVSALLVLVGLSVVVLQYFVAVFWFEGRYERELARHGIVQSGDALNQAVVPALWLTLAVVALQAGAIALVVRAVRRRRRQPAVAA
jgi:di/tricarboxylate transporter